MDGSNKDITWVGDSLQLQLAIWIHFTAFMPSVGRQKKRNWWILARKTCSTNLKGLPLGDSA